MTRALTGWVSDDKICIAPPLLSRHVAAERGLSGVISAAEAIVSSAGNFEASHPGLRAEARAALGSLREAVDRLFGISMKTLVRKDQWMADLSRRVDEGRQHREEQKEGQRDGKRAQERERCTICVGMRRTDQFLAMPCCGQELCSACVPSVYWESTVSLSRAKGKCPFCNARSSIAELLGA
jgi:hypothetical protein